MPAASQLVAERAMGRERRPVREMHFRSKEDYRKWLAYGHVRTPRGKKARTVKESMMGRSKRRIKIYIARRPHHVRH